MGSGASSNVKKISIDQSDNKWDQYKGSRASSSSSKRSESSLGKRLLQSVSSASSERRRNEEIRAVLVTTEKKLADAEDKIRNLQRELCTLELRNNELIGETNWLKQQIGQPDMPLRLRSPKDAEAWIHDLEKRFDEELNRYKVELENQRKSNDDRIVQLTSEFEHKIAVIQEELINEKLTNKKLKATIENYERAEDKKRMKEVLTSIPSPSPSELTIARSYTPPSSPVAQDDVMPLKDNRKLSAEYINGNVDIDDGRESAEENRMTIQKNEKEVVFTPSTSNSVMPQPQVLLYTTNYHTISLTEPKRVENSFKNVYALSESMEPIKVMETPRMSSSIRPSTADVMCVDTHSSDKTEEDSMECADRKSLGLLRGSSAPVLFKSRSRAHRRERFHESTYQTDDDPHTAHVNNEDTDFQRESIKETYNDDIDEILNAKTTTLFNPYEGGRSFSLSNHPPNVF